MKFYDQPDETTPPKADYAPTPNPDSDEEPLTAAELAEDALEQAEMELQKAIDIESANPNLIPLLSPEAGVAEMERRLAFLQAKARRSIEREDDHVDQSLIRDIATTQVRLVGYRAQLQGRN